MIIQCMQHTIKYTCSVASFQKGILCVSPCWILQHVITCYHCHYHLHDPLRTPSNNRAIVNKDNGSNHIKLYKPNCAFQRKCHLTCIYLQFSKISVTVSQFLKQNFIIHDVIFMKTLKFLPSQVSFNEIIEKKYQ